jgi:hypothetical protein
MSKPATWLFTTLDARNRTRDVALFAADSQKMQSGFLEC